MNLVLGAGRLDRRISDAEQLLLRFHNDFGILYLDYRPLTPPDLLVVEDLGITLLMNSQIRWAAARSVLERGHMLDLRSLPSLALEETGEAEREEVAHVIAAVANWPGLGASTATKILHKKRPALIPILDNQAVFGAYMNPNWPDRHSNADTIKASDRIQEALDWIAYDLTRSDNESVWGELAKLEPTRSRVELFDMIWWIYFRDVEPVGG